MVNSDSSMFGQRNVTGEITELRTSELKCDEIITAHNYLFLICLSFSTSTPKLSISGNIT